MMPCGSDSAISAMKEDESVIVLSLDVMPDETSWKSAVPSFIAESLSWKNPSAMNISLSSIADEKDESARESILCVLSLFIW